MKALIDHTLQTRSLLGLALVVEKTGGYSGVEALLAAGASINKSQNGRTALEAAAGGGYIDVVERLLAGSDMNAAPAEYEGRTALQAAAAGGHIDVVDRLLAARADVNAAPAQYGGLTALEAAANDGRHGIFQRLKEAGAGRECLHMAQINSSGPEMNTLGRPSLLTMSPGGHVNGPDSTTAGLPCQP